MTSIALPDVSGRGRGDHRQRSCREPAGAAHPRHGAAQHDYRRPPVGTTVDGTGTTASPATPAGQAWTGAFESPIEDAFYPPSGDTWGNQTIRIAASPNVGVAAGAQIRIRLSNPGYWSEDGTGPLTIGAATIAPRTSGAVPEPGTMQTLTFGGQDSVAIPVGGDIYSDPLTLNFPVTAGKDLLVSLYVENASLPVLPLNSYPSGGMAWFASSATPNETGDTTGTPFTGDGGYSLYSVPILTGVDVTTPAERSARTRRAPTEYPGEPTVVVAGDNVIDGSTASAQQDAPDAPSQRLGGYLAGDLAQLAATEQAAGDNAPLYGVVDAGVQSNLVTADGSFYGNGVAGRRARACPAGRAWSAGLTATFSPSPASAWSSSTRAWKTCSGTTAPQGDQTLLQDDYQIIQEQLEAFGIQPYFGTLTPCGGYPTARQGRRATRLPSRPASPPTLPSPSSPGSCSADFSAVVAQAGTSSPVDLATADNIGDGVNLTQGSDGGYAALAQAVINTATDPLSPCPIVPVRPQAPETS